MSETLQNTAMTRWAVFDVDGTLLPDTSMEKIFIRHAVGSGLISPAGGLRAMGMAARHLLCGKFGATLRENKAYLTQLPVKQVEEFARRIFGAAIAPRFSQTGSENVAHCRAAGYKILFMTGAPAFLANYLADQFRFDHLIATQLATRDGCFAGKISGLHPFGPAKRSLLLAAAPLLAIDFSNSRVFANHHSDIVHMTLFGLPTAVNPDPGLAAFARAHGWPQEVWR